ncbi:MAG: M48 family metallopeptidase [Bacteroidota bacterium]
MNSLLVILLVIISAGFIGDLILDILNIRNMKPDLPLILKDCYDRERYKKSQLYLRENGNFRFILSSLGFVVIMLMFILGGFTWLNSMVMSVTDSPIWAALLFFGILGLASDLGSTPFDIWSTFVIEEKYGFNKTTPKTFILDKLKSWLLVLLIGTPLAAFIIWIYTKTGSWFWIFAWVVLSLFSLFMSLFYSTLIVPLFNKQKPLEEGSLRTEIEALATKTGFTLDKIFVIDGSKRSSKANAYFSGFGRKKRIVLFDTLIEELQEKEILAVLAHEIGHYRKKHIIRSMALSLVQSAVILFIFSLVIGNPTLSAALNIPEPSFHIGVLVFGVLFSPVSTLTGLLTNSLSRKYEYQADEFAAQAGFAHELGDALIGLSEKNLSNLTPHRAYAFVNYSHPTLLQRLARLIPPPIPET